MKTKAMKAGFAVSAFALAIPSAMAAEIRFDGFASFVAGQVLDKDELGESDFRGFDERLDFQQNSVFALQARADLQDRLSATAQVIAKGSDDYDAKFNWAYLTYELSNELSIKAGRFRTPLFMYSDFLDVGYAYHWISPPDSVYNLSGFDTTDGIMLEYQTDIGPLISVATFTASRTNVGLETGTVDTTNSLAVTWSLNYDWLTFRVVHSEADVTVSGAAFDGLSGGLAQSGVSQSSIDNMLLDSDRGAFSGVGISADFGQFFGVAEYTEVLSENAFSADPKKSWYVSGGARFGKFTAYATIENTKADINEAARDEITAQLDPAIAFLSSQNPAPGTPEYAQLAGLQALRGGVVSIFNQTGEDAEIYSIGMRYNFHPSAAFKIEYLEMDDKLTDLKPAAIAVAVDLVY